MQIYSTLYSRDTTGNIRVWWMEREDSRYRTVAGIKDGEMVQSEWRQAFAMNIGRSNATTPEEQADREVKSSYEKKLRMKYHESENDVDKDKYFKPMLAQDYGKRYTNKNKNLSFPVYTQPKLDGCFSYHAPVLTDKGYLKIGDIVENKLNVNVACWNEVTSEIEYKPVINWFNNGNSPHTDWMEVTCEETGLYFRCTRNHKIYDPISNKWTRADEMDGREVLIHPDTARAPVIRGLLLGDGCLVLDSRSPSGSPRISFSSSITDAINHKKDLVGGTKISEQKSGYGTQIYASTRALRSICSHDEFYEINTTIRKIVPSNKLRQLLTLESLAIWYADDGSITNNNGNPLTPRMSISIHRHPEGMIKEFVEFFEKEYDVTPSFQPDKRITTKDCANGTLWFTTKDTLLLQNHLRHVGVRGMEYKWYFPIEKYMSKSNSALPSSKIKWRKARNTGKQTKYDIEVADNHNYFVAGVLVHNCRCIVTAEGAWSRTGKPIVAIPHILEALEPLFENDSNLVLDGELYNHELSHDFNKITSVVRKLDPTPQQLSESVELIQYHVYDCPSVDGDFNDRFTVLCDILRSTSSSVVLVDTQRVHDQHTLDELYASYMEAGYEGQMIRRSGTYEQKRSNTLLKRKEFQDAEYEIVRIEAGQGNWSGYAKRVVCRLGDGREFGSSLKGNQEYALKVLQNSDSYIGKQATVRYQNLTPDGVPRFPIAHALHLEDRW